MKRIKNYAGIIGNYAGIIRQIIIMLHYKPTKYSLVNSLVAISDKS